MASVDADRSHAVHVAGFPESGSVQEVLFFQTQTVRMMYKIVADALRDMNITDEHPRDYLIFTTIGGERPLRVESSTSLTACAVWHCILFWLVR